MEKHCLPIGKPGWTVMAGYSILTTKITQQHGKNPILWIISVKGRIFLKIWLTHLTQTETIITNVPPLAKLSIFRWQNDDLQINLCLKNLFLQQLTHNMTKDCTFNYEFYTWKLQTENMLCTQIDFFWIYIQNNLCTQHVLSL